MTPNPSPLRASALGALLLLAAACSQEAESPQYDGAALYQANCANCHGVYGEGDGAVTPSLAVTLNDLRYLSARNDAVFPATFARAIIDGRELRAAHGPAGMPVWGSAFQLQEGYDDNAEVRVNAKIDALVDFLESIQLPAEEAR